MTEYDLDVNEKSERPEKDDVKAFITDDHRTQLAHRLGKSVTDEDVGGNEEIDYLLDVISNMSDEEAYEILSKAVEFHKGDPNFHESTLEKIHQLLDNSPELQMSPYTRLYNMKIEACLIHYHSPYAETRAVSDPYDNPDTPVETFRA